MPVRLGDEMVNREVVIVVAVGLISSAEAGTTIYVDDDALLGGDGSCWATAYRFLQDALQKAAADPSISDIRVAQGQYTPDSDEAGNVTPGDRGASFQLVTGVVLSGGFAGMGAPDPDAHDSAAFESILSGDLLGDDDSSDPPPGSSYDDNSLHVVTGSGVAPTAVLQGFTVTAGIANLDQGAHHAGAGMYNAGGSPTVQECTFRNNYAQGNGAGMFNSAGGPQVTDCVFIKNRADGRGGGMENEETSLAVVSRSSFINNSAGIYGGGMRARGNTVVRECTFLDNGAFRGGGVGTGFGSPSIERCLFVDNSAVAHGGGLHAQSGQATIVNCVFWSNDNAIEAKQGTVTITNTSIASNTSGGLLVDSATVTVTNSIIAFNNLYQIDLVAGAIVTVNHSIVPGWLGAGTNNILAGPQFVDLPDGDLRLLPGSPAIDAGDNAALPGDVTVDYAGRPRFVDDPDTPDCPQAPGQCGDPPLVDIGAHEFQPCPWDCDGNYDGTADVADLLALLGQYDPAAPGECTGGTCDFDGDGCVDVDDLLKLLAHFDPDNLGCPQ